MLTGLLRSFYIQFLKRGFSSFLDNIYNRKNTLYRVLSEHSGIKRVINKYYTFEYNHVLSEHSGIKRCYNIC